MVPSQDSNPRPINRKYNALPIAPLCHLHYGSKNHTLTSNFFWENYYNMWDKANRYGSTAGMSHQGCAISINGDKHKLQWIRWQNWSRSDQLKLTSHCMQTILDRMLLRLLQDSLPTLQMDFENTHTHLKKIPVILAQEYSSTHYIGTCCHFAIWWFLDRFNISPTLTLLTANQVFKLCMWPIIYVSMVH